LVNVLALNSILQMKKGIEKTFAEIKKGNKVPHILINNAGISGVSKYAIDYTEEEFDQVLNTNLKGAFLMSKHFSKNFIDAKKTKL